MIRSLYYVSFPSSHGAGGHRLNVLAYLLFALLLYCCLKGTRVCLEVVVKRSMSGIPQLSNNQGIKRGVENTVSQNVLFHKRVPTYFINFCVEHYTNH